MQPKVRNVHIGLLYYRLLFCVLNKRFLILGTVLVSYDYTYGHPSLQADHADCVRPHLAEGASPRGRVLILLREPELSRKWGAPMRLCGAISVARHSESAQHNIYVLQNEALRSKPHKHLSKTNLCTKWHTLHSQHFVQPTTHWCNQSKPHSSLWAFSAWGEFCTKEICAETQIYWLNQTHHHQGAYGCWKSLKMLEIVRVVFKVWKVLEFWEWCLNLG